jgi:hypothetical protein
MDLLVQKGADYAGQVDALANLKKWGAQGIIVRLGDKMSRLENLFKTRSRGVMVKDESLIDTIRDARNYLFLLQIFLEGKDKDPDAPLFRGDEQDPKEMEGA